MKNILFCLLALISSSFVLKSQNTRSTSNCNTYVQVDSKTHLSKRDCQLVIITQDSLLIKRIKKSSINYEMMSCYDSSKGTSTMVWIHEKYQNQVDDLFKEESGIFVENLKQ